MVKSILRETIGNDSGPPEPEVASLTSQEAKQGIEWRREEIRALGPPEQQLSIFQQYMAPGDRLPPELLAKIFLHCVPWPTTSKPWVEEPMDSWIPVSHVCRYWRDVALDTPELWSLINFDHADLAKEFLVRSKAFPISAQMSLGSDPRPPPAPFLYHLSRTAMLSFHADDLKALFNAPRTSAPHLNTLTISVGAVAAWNCDPSILSIFLENLVAPPLRHLEITNWMIPWNHSIFRSTITTLVLELERSYVGDREVLLHEWDQMLDALGNMQSLETLSLQHIASPSPSPTIHSIFLPKLCSLKLLSSPATSCGLFLAHCSSPSIALPPFDFRPVADDLFFKSLSISGKFSPDTIWDLSITRGRKRALIYKFTSSDGRESVGNHPTINLTVADRPVFLSDLSYLGIPLSSVGSLHMEAIPPKDKVRENWAMLAAQLPNLTTLVVQGKAAAGLPRSLYPAIRVSWETIDSPQAVFPFPHLRILVFERVNPESICSGYCVGLEAALRKRKDNGLKLEKLRFIKVNYLPVGEPTGLAELLGCKVEVSPELED